MAGGSHATLQLVGHHHGEGKLEQVVVGRAGKLRPEKRRKAALLEQGKLVGMIGTSISWQTPRFGDEKPKCGPINTDDWPFDRPVS
jgi:hypothetical protein